MNWDIVFSLIRNLGPPILTYAAGRWPEYAGTIGEVAAGIATLGAAGWGATTHTDSGKIAAVEAMPDVKQIVAVSTPSADSAVKAAAVDPDRPKVVAATMASFPPPAPSSSLSQKFNTP
jgi:hypothetical protein